MDAFAAVAQDSVRSIFAAAGGGAGADGEASAPPTRLREGWYLGRSTLLLRTRRAQLSDVRYAVRGSTARCRRL